MEGKPVQDTGPTSVSPGPAPDASKSSKPGQFGPYKTEVQHDVKPKMPSASPNVFQKLDGLFLPVPDDFFSIFERPLMGRPMEDVFNSVQAFNVDLLDQMGFPQENHQFFSLWALVDSDLATTTDEESQSLLEEARELLNAAPEKEVQEKITVFVDGQVFEIQPNDKASKKAFDKLWAFFERLFTSPFSLLSSKKDQKEFTDALDILSRRIHGPQSRTVQATTPNASVKPSAETGQQSAKSLDRQKEEDFILRAHRQTPVYYGGELCHIVEPLDDQRLKLQKNDKTEVDADVTELYLPPVFKDATRICNPADVDLPPDGKLSDVREQELLYICGYLQKGDPVIYKDQPCTVMEVTSQATSPQIRLKTVEGDKEIDAALHHIHLPPEDA